MKKTNRYGLTGLLGIAAVVLTADLQAAQVFSQNLDHRSPGRYTKAMMQADWNRPTWNNGVDQGRVSVVSANADETRSYLRVTYPANQYGPWNGGAQWKVLLSYSGWDTLESIYRVRFEVGFDFKKGGKLPGLCGGDCNTGGKKPNGYDGWSARNMWRREGQVVQNLYYPDQPGIYAIDLPYAINGKNVYFIPGRWHEIRVRIQLNSPGVRNGWLEAWFDGQLGLDIGGLRLRDTDSIKINQLYFSTFHGGNDASWSPSVTSYANFSSFSVRTVDSPRALK
jgi:hypothetical protein